MIRLQTLNGRETQVDHENANGETVDERNERTGRKKLFCSPEKEGCSKKNSFRTHVSRDGRPEMDENVGGADQQQGQRGQVQVSRRGAKSMKGVPADEAR